MSECPAWLTKEKGPPFLGRWPLGVLLRQSPIRRGAQPKKLKGGFTKTLATVSQPANRRASSAASRCRLSCPSLVWNLLPSPNLLRSIQCSHRNCGAPSRTAGQVAALLAILHAFLRSRRVHQRAPDIVNRP